MMIAILIPWFHIFHYKFYPPNQQYNRASTILSSEIYHLRNIAMDGQTSLAVHLREGAVVFIQAHMQELLDREWFYLVLPS